MERVRALIKARFNIGVLIVAGLAFGLPFAFSGHLTGERYGTTVLALLVPLVIILVLLAKGPPEEVGPEGVKWPEAVRDTSDALREQIEHQQAELRALRQRVDSFDDVERELSLIGDELDRHTLRDDRLQGQIDELAEFVTKPEGG